MTIAPGLFTGHEEKTIEEIAGYESDNVTINTAAANQHVDGSGDLHGLQSLLHGASGTMIYRFRRTDIPWEEVVAETWALPSGTGTGYFRFLNSTTNTNEIRRNSTGTMSHYVNGVIKDTTTDLALIGDRAVMISSHLYYHASAGFITTWIDGQQKLTSTSQNTEAGAASCDGWESKWTAGGSLYTDDVGIRPRTILVDGVTSADSATPTAITGGITADVYGWENDSDDSANNGGDPTLPAATWRLYLKNVSFGPEDHGSGWSNNDTVTVTGLTGTIAVLAPAANYVDGMEPGSMFYYQRLHILGMAISGVGTENTDGTLQGSPSDRADALDTVGDGLEVRHTAAAESVTLAVTGLTAAHEAVIDSVVGLVVSVRGLTDGSPPDSLIPRVLDNAANAQNGMAKVVGGTNTSVHNMFPVNGTGGIWATGTGAGGVDSSEPGYETL
jgi:hypothetical protein